jgi:DNA (cytosine-5)-methyltransferase 3A
MSCGRIALERAGIPVERYYASEIDKHAIKVSQANYPDIIQLGDIRKVHAKDLPEIDMIIGGSPCTGFSFAGKGLNFNDPQSKLFFEYVRLLKEIKPKYFLLENVRMKQEYENVISEILGGIYPECVKQKGLFSEGMLKPVLINSALVSAQNRERNYWCNWEVTQPADKGIMLKDIIDTNAGIKINGESQIKNDKSQCLDANYAKGIDNHGQRTAVLCGAMRGRYNEKGNIQQQIETNTTGKTNTLMTVQKDNLCIMVGEADLNGHDYVKRVYSVEGKAPSLCTGSGGNHEPKLALENMQWRKLTPEECCKLQTVDPQYIANGRISNSQAYKMLGNGWTIDVVSHIFRSILPADLPRGKK